MSKKACKVISVIFCIIAMIGLLSFAGGVRAVNAGAFIFPAVISLWAFFAYRKK